MLPKGVTWAWLSLTNLGWSARQIKNSFAGFADMSKNLVVFFWGVSYCNGLFSVDASVYLSRPSDADGTVPKVHLSTRFFDASFTISGSGTERTFTTTGVCMAYGAAIKFPDVRPH